jgi:hypothetical protein
MHPHMLRHAFVTTMLDAGDDPSDAQIAARHADPRTTMRYNRTRRGLSRWDGVAAGLAERTGLRASLSEAMDGTGLAVAATTLVRCWSTTGLPADLAPKPVFSTVER